MSRQPPSPHAWRRCGGFTLIEMMVSLVMLAFLGLLLAGSVGFSSQAAALSSTRGMRLDALWTAYALLRGQIASAYPRAGTAPDAQSFAGKSDALVFVAPTPARLGLAGDQRLTVRVEGAPGQRRLVALWRSLAGAGQQQAARRSVLIDGLDDAAFAYFGAAGAGDEVQWHDEWSGDLPLPRLVRFTASFADGTMAPLLLVAPRLSRRDR